MVIVVCRITLALHGNRSLKGKRQIVKSLVNKVRNRFNVSVAEVGDNDLWQRAVIGVSAVGNDRSFLNSKMDKVINLIEGLNTAEIVSRDMEIMNF
ncbi:MAG: DUF503 domain-containing protein [Thermodesulfobacteriota bacterium]|nr:MAG: DUF503 domain-containing protein [Thermodesulfobacteriota bacterium]